MPENFLKKVNAKILPQWKVCFFSALLVGLIAHLYKITGWLPNWDSLVFRYDSQNMLGLGRWFLPVVCSFSSFYDLPFLNGLIAIVFHGLGAVCICRVLNIRRKITAFLTGALIVSFPTVTSVMMYNYVADGYSIAFFLSALAAVFMTEKKPRYVLAAVLITLSTGIYQAYITVTIALVLVKLIDEIIYSNCHFSVLFKKSLFMLLTGIGGVVLYGIILRVLLNFFSVELLDYQGLNATASMSALNLASSFYLTKETFIKFFFDFSKGVNVYVVLNSIILIFTFFYYIKYTVQNNIHTKPVKLILLLLLCPALVVGANILAFINAQVDYHNLMLMGYSVFYLLFLILYERGKADRFTAVKCWIVLLAGVALIANQVVIANVSYHKAQMAYEKSYGVIIRIADRIEQTPGAEECENILVIGCLENSKDYSVNLPPEITGITDGFIVRFDDETVGQSVFTSTLNDYCGKNYRFLSGDEKKKLAGNPEVTAMGKWPESNCIRVVEDTLVVKLGTEGEN